MIDFDIKKFTRVCATTGRELAPGEEFYSVLLPVGSDVQRADYSLQGWTGPPEGAIGWWRSQVPDPRSNKISWAPSDVMLDYFTSIADDASKADVRYVLTLLMLRRRILRLDETEVEPGGREVMHLYCTRNATQYEVAVVTPPKQRADAIQQELIALLFSNDDKNTQPE